MTVLVYCLVVWNHGPSPLGRCRPILMGIHFISSHDQDRRSLVRKDGFGPKPSDLAALTVEPICVLHVSRPVVEPKMSFWQIA